MESKNQILEILESLGKIFPSEAKSVDRFEVKFKNEIKNAIPKFWDNPLEILKSGYIEKVATKNPSELFNSQGMSQAARKGGTIPDEIMKKMLEDRKNAEKD